MAWTFVASSVNYSRAGGMASGGGSYESHSFWCRWGTGHRIGLSGGIRQVESLGRFQDVEEIATRFRTVAYDKPVSVAPGIDARWIEAGHLLGSASIQLTVEEDGHKKTVVFSGDLGQFGAPLTRYASTVDKADAVFLESTYGNRNHRAFKDTLAEFTEVVRRASEQGGKILVPTFAVGRAQLLVVLLAWLFRKKEVKPFPVYLDSPMAIKATQIYLEHPELWHDVLKEIVRERPLREELPGQSFIGP